MRTSPRVPLTHRRGLRDSLPPASLLIALLLAVSTGCGQHATRTTSPVAETSTQLLPAPDGAQLPGLPLDLLQGSATYPLAVGNTWDYDIHERVVTTPPEGDPFVYEDHRPFRSVIVGTSQIYERDYFLQSEYDPRFELPTYGPTFALRQDGTGLYHMDVFYLLGDQARGSSDGGAMHAARPSGEALGASLGASLADSPHRAAFERAALELTTRLESMRRAATNLPDVPGGAESGELTMLDYPLRVGAHWVVRASPRFERTVLRREHLELPIGDVSAWRLRGQSELYGPEDRVSFWYGDAGLVRSLVHARLYVRDDFGRVVGEVFGTWDQKLVQFSNGIVVGPGARGAVAAAGSTR